MGGGGAAGTVSAAQGPFIRPLAPFSRKGVPHTATGGARSQAMALRIVFQLRVVTRVDLGRRFSVSRVLVPR